VQNFCPNCQIITERQHHKHSKSIPAILVCYLLNFSYVAQETSLALI
jgi:hypothetical protein